MAVDNFLKFPQRVYNLSTQTICGITQYFGAATLPTRYILFGFAVLHNLTHKSTDPIPTALNKNITSEKRREQCAIIFLTNKHGNITILSNGNKRHIAKTTINYYSPIKRAEDNK